MFDRISLDISRTHWKFMDMSLQSELKNKVLDLPRAERAELARDLILSLEDQVADPDADAAWEVEIERRLAAVDRGEVQPVDWRDAIERIRGTLKGRKSE
jgi:putative addiction module component (TIGR02574 family)